MIKITQLNKHYKKEIFNNLNLDINEPSINLIIGESGIGKSTLLNIIYQIDKKYTGNVEVFNNIVYGSNISLVNQSNALIKRFTALDNILIAQNNDDIELIHYYAEKLLITDLLNKKVKNLSAGEKQRVAILKAIINQPNILLLDEPTSHLDTTTTNEVISLFKELELNGMIIIITTHDHRLIEQFDNVYRIHNKTIETIKHSNTNITLRPTNETRNNNILSYVKMNLKTQKFLYLLYVLVVTISCLFFIGSISNSLAINNDYNEKINDLFSTYDTYYVNNSPDENSDDVYYYGDYIVQDYYLSNQETIDDNNITTEVPLAISLNSYTDNNEYIITNGEKPDEVNEIIISEDVESYYNQNYNDTLINKEVVIIEDPSKQDSHNTSAHKEFAPTTITITGTYKTYEYATPKQNDYEYNGITLTTKAYGTVENPINNTYQYTIHTTNDTCNEQNCVTKDNYYQYSDFIYLFDAVILQTIALFIAFVTLFFLMSMLILIPRKKELAYLYSIGITKLSAIIAFVTAMIILYTISYTISIFIYKLFFEQLLYQINFINIIIIYLILGICLLLPALFVVLTTKKSSTY